MIFRHLLNMRSHPTWVRGLKRAAFGKIFSQVRSHPTWVRGLKHATDVCAAAGGRVAPYVGAWIETFVSQPETQTDRSHPTWVRGLKPPYIPPRLRLCGRTLRGCVD